MLVWSLGEAVVASVRTEPTAQLAFRLGDPAAETKERREKRETKRQVRGQETTVMDSTQESGTASCWKTDLRADRGAWTPVTVARR